MIDENEEAYIQRKFGVPRSQIERDHAISHVLFALQNLKSDFVFFGGTGLARTFLPEGRLSEDIDLFTEKRVELCTEIESLPEWIEQEFPDAAWVVHPVATRDPNPALISCGSGIQIQIQIVDGALRGWKDIPTIKSRIEQRFSDVPKTELVVPTFDGFVAMKALVWFERQAPRDLFDLAELADVGPVTDVARDAVARIIGFPISATMLDRSVKGEWIGQLRNQTQNYGSEAECLREVLAWWNEDPDA
jgi:predicted nucleotidyltransferase component of viral defense system